MGSTLDPNVRYDPTSMGLDYNVDDTWANVRAALQKGAWTAVDDASFGQTTYRHTNLAKEQWRDPSKTTRTWPDPPLAQRAWSFDAHLGVHAGDEFHVDIATIQDGANFDHMTISQFAVTEDAGPDVGVNVPQGGVTALAYNGATIPDFSKKVPGVRKGVLIGNTTTQYSGLSYASSTFMANTYIWPPGAHDRWSNPGTNVGLRHEIVGSARHIYEPHFVSSPCYDGLTFNREGIDTTRVTYAGIDTINAYMPLSGGAYRMIYDNPRGENRDHGVSQTQKVPTGGIGGNPFWLKDTKDWPDILKSLHFDFMPFMVPQAKTRPVNYRFWDSMYSTALFGGPTFAIVLDDYGIFDEEYYRMVISHFTQSEMQIVQWRQTMFAGNPALAGDHTALFPRNYVNPHAWHQAKVSGKIAYWDGNEGHPFKDTQASDFIGGAFSMAGWRGPCCELVLGLPPDADSMATPQMRKIDPGLPETYIRYTSPDNPDLIRKIYPYYDSREELSMDSKRKLHESNMYAAHPFAVQDYYNTFVLAATANATYRLGQDIFDYKDGFEDIERLSPAMFSHKIMNSPHDIPFTVGRRFMQLMLSTSNSTAMSSMAECFDNAIVNDSLLVKLHGPIVSSGMAHVKSALSQIQLFALNKLRDAIKANANIIAEKYLWPVVSSLFPNLAPLIKKNLEKLANAAITIDFTKPMATWLPSMTAKLSTWGGGVAGDVWELFTKGSGVDWLTKDIHRRFVQRPDVVGTGEEAGAEMGEFPLGEGWSFPKGSYDDFLRETGEPRFGPFEGLDTIPEEMEELGTAMAEVEEVVNTAVEASMAAMCGPMIVMVAITFVLDMWTAKMEQDAKDAAAAADAAAAWKAWDTMRIPFDTSYLRTLGSRLNKLAGYGTVGDANERSLAEVVSLYRMGVNDETFNNLADETYDQRDIQEGAEKDGDSSVVDPGYVRDAISNYRAQMRAFLNETPPHTVAEITQYERELSNSLNSVMRGANNQNQYKGSTGQRYLNLDPNLHDPTGKTNASVPCGGDLRTVANLIAMNHLALCVINPTFFELNTGGVVTTASTVRAQQLLVTAEIIRTMRVVDHFMRAASWGEWGWVDGSRPDQNVWRPYPPMPGPDMVPTSLQPAYMTPIPVLVPTTNDLPKEWYDQLDRNVGRPFGGTRNLFDSVEHDFDWLWEAFVSSVKGMYGACPTYTFTDRTHDVPTKDGPPVKIQVRTRAVPVPIFAPGRSPTMFVSSLDPTFAWPTLAMKGGNMSAFINEMQYFSYLDEHKICMVPNADSTDQIPLVAWLTAALKKDPSCFPMLGDTASLFLLQPDPTPYFERTHHAQTKYFPGEFSVVNRSSSTIVVVCVPYDTADGAYHAEGATLQPGQQTMASNAPTPGIQKFLYYVTPVEMYAISDLDYQYADASKDIQTAVGVGASPKYRSYSFALNRVTPYAGDFTGTVTVFDNVATTTSIQQFEALMRHQIVPIMNNNGHCYEPLNAFWTTYYKSITTQPVAFHNTVCKWLLTKISVGKNGANIPVAQPLDKDQQMCIFTLGKSIFTGKPLTWEASWTNFKATKADWGVFNQSSCKDVDAGDHHPKTYPEGGYRVHYSIAYTDDVDPASTAASYSYEPERTTIAQGLTRVAGIMSTLLPGGAKAGETYPQYTDALTASANDILNNDQDQYDAYTDWLTELPPSSDAIFIFGQAEAVRIARISAISRLTSDIENERAKKAIAAYVQIAPPSKFTRALGMLFTVRANPAIVLVTDAYFRTYPALHQLAMQMCKDSYNNLSTNPRTNLVHPTTKQIAYYQTTGDLASAPEYAVYFMPTLYEAGTDIAGPTIFIAFRGTVLPEALLTKFTNAPHGTDVFQQIAAFMSPYSDLMTDMALVLGTQAESARFQDSDALVQAAAKYKMNIILTGHSLGGAIATHCLETTSAVTAAIVFNPARGMDDAYFDQVVNDETVAYVKRNTVITDTEALPQPYSDGDEGGVNWIIPPGFYAEDDMKARKITGIVIPGTVTTVFISDYGTWYVTYQWAATEASTLTAMTSTSVTREYATTDVKATDTGHDDDDNQPIMIIPTTFSADDDLRKRKITGLVVPGSVDVNNYMVVYDYVSFSADDAAADIKKKGINGTFAPNSIRWGDLTQKDSSGLQILTVSYDYTYVDFSSQWYDKLVTHRVAGKSAMPIDDDPVSVLSGGVGTTYEYVGPGVPSKLDAHTCDNWDTTLVLRDGGTAIIPNKPR
jgi:hypothetical protein